MISQNKKAFTLVELIVVITILAILGTIGFLSFQGYATTARDSARISDLNTIAKSLDLFKLQGGFYPVPSDAYDVTYSGSLAWKQGIFGTETRQLTGRISDIPLDPLTKNPYAYSVTNTGQEYELGAITEGLIGGSIKAPRTVFPHTQVNADNSFFTYIKGNYNKQIVTVKEPTRLYILGVPTIITTEIASIDVRDILSRQSFAVSGSKNLPGSYSLNLPEGQTSTGSISFTSGTIANAPVLFEGTIGELSGSDSKQLLGENLVAYYTSSNIGNKSTYSALGNISTGQEYQYINTLVQSNVSGLGTKQIALSTQSPSNVGVVLGNTTGGIIGGDIDLLAGAPSNCMNMTQEHLDNLNNWMSITLSDDFFGNPGGLAEGTQGTSNLTLSQWCSIKDIETIGEYIGANIPKEVGYLDGLTYIGYGDQGISSIPETLVLLENLQDVYLQGNNLGNLLLARFDWVDGYTCEDGVGSLGTDMCLELAGGEDGDGGFDDGGFGGGDFGFPSSDNLKFVFRGPQHLNCEDTMTNTQLNELNNWGTSTLGGGGTELTIAPGGSSSLTKAEWCSVKNITNADRVDGPLITFIPGALRLLPSLESIILPFEDISLLPQDITSLRKLQTVDFSGNFDLGNLSFPFDQDSTNTCENFEYIDSVTTTMCVLGTGFGVEFYEQPEDINVM